MLQEAIANGAVSALAITTVESLSDLNDLNKWDGRTVYVKDVANFKYDSADEEWVLVGNTAVSVVDASGKTQQELNDSQKPYNRPNISVFNFGAKGDKVTDDILAIESARDYAKLNDGCLWLPPVTSKHQDGVVSDYAFRITRTLFIPAKLDFIMDSPILWDGPADQPAIVIGTPIPANKSQFSEFNRLKFWVQNKNTAPWGTAGSVGVWCYPLQQCRIDFKMFWL